MQKSSIYVSCATNASTKCSGDHMIKEKILNSFISSNMQRLGLHHVNSEVPKVVAEHIGKRTDILGFDLATSIPIILELKVKRDPQVVEQLQEYMSRQFLGFHRAIVFGSVSNKTDNLFWLNHSIG